MDAHEPSNRQQVFLTGTHVARIDAKRRLKIPMQLMDSLITLNGSQRKLYLSIEDGEDKINVFTLLAMDKMKKDFGDLPLTDVETRKKMEKFGSSIHETPINKDGRITIHEDILSKVEVKRDTEVMIKGAIEYITISKKSM